MPNKIAISDLELSAISGWKPKQPFNQIPVASVLEQSAKTGWVQYISPGFKNPIFNTIPSNANSLESSAISGWQSNQPFNTIPSNANSLESTALQSDIDLWSSAPGDRMKLMTQIGLVIPNGVKSLESMAPQLNSDDWKTKRSRSDLAYSIIPTKTWLWQYSEDKDIITQQVGTIIPITNDTSLEKSAAPGWTLGTVGNSYSEGKIDTRFKSRNLDPIEIPLKVLVNSALSPFGVAANSLTKLDIPGDSTYETVPYYEPKLRNNQAALTDFRSLLLQRPLNGASAALRNPGGSSTLYAALSATVGPYLVFGRSAPGKKGKGWGDHDSITAPRLDFTARSNINTVWSATANRGRGGWVSPLLGNPLEKITPFRGDKVTVVDFKKATKLKDTYRWKPTSKSEILGALIDKAGVTSDFIKFYFTGPSIVADGNQKDDIMVFRAIINTLTDTYSPQYTPVQMIGRADPNFHYSQYGREMGLDFTVYATDRDEMKPIYRKLNALAGYTAPTYSASSIGLTAPWMRITIGDLLVQQPVLITSLTYGLTDSDTTWEINIEDDPEMMQAPHRVTVSMGLTVIADWLPEKGGRFYSLAKMFDDQGLPIKGSSNWLSDSSGNSTFGDKLSAITSLGLPSETAPAKLAPYTSKIELPSYQSKPNFGSGIFSVTLD